MKVLVPVKRVADPDNANKVTIPAGGDRVDTTGMEWKANPFDEYALEAALRLTEEGSKPKARLGEVIAVTFGGKDTEATLRTAMATGADKAIRIDAEDDKLDGHLVARALKTLVEQEKPDLVLMGKQAVDGDTNQVGQILAEMLGWPMATFVASLQEEQGGLLAGREVDGGTLLVRVKLPAVVTVDLRIVHPLAVFSLKTPKTHKYNEGVRFASLPAIMQAKRKPLAVKALKDLAADASLKVKYLRFEPPPARKAGIKVPDVATLVDKLQNEAKVL